MQGKISGCELYRQIIPHEYMQNCTTSAYSVEKAQGGYDKQKEISWVYDMRVPVDEEVKQYNIVSFLRVVNTKQGESKKCIERLQRCGCKVVFDIDDYWKLPSSHYQYKYYKRHKVADYKIEAIRAADVVTTTTEHFAEIIYEYNKNVAVLPNCILPYDKQFIKREIESPRIRFGWIGGIYHKCDIGDIEKTFPALYADKEIKNKWQICLGGFTLNPESVYMERIMTNNYDVSKEYFEYLKQGTEASEHISFDQPYRRLWGKEYWNYGDMYNQIDVALIPLRMDSFNACKSELKLIEAGTMKKPCIVSNVLPYKTIAKDGTNALCVDPFKNETDWYLYIKKLIKEPNLRKDLGEALYETVKEKFNIETITKKRIELYDKLTN